MEPLAFDALHPAGHQMHLAWEAQESEEDDPDGPMPTYEICVDGAGCQNVSSTSSGVAVSALSAGVRELSITVHSVGGLSSTDIWHVLVDATPPAMSSVRIAEDALYWGVENEVNCTFGLASDPESGIEFYDVAIVQPAASCGDAYPSGLGGIVVSTQNISVEEIDCNATEVEVTISASFEHLGRYRCVVTAFNGAGLKSSRSSSDFFVDLSRATFGLGMVQLSTDEGLPLAYTANTTIRVDFEYDLTIDAAVLNPAQVVTGTASPLASANEYSLQVQIISTDTPIHNATSPSALLLLSAPTSPCCVSTQYPAGPRSQHHDSWILGVGWPSNQSVTVAALIGTETVLVSDGIFYVVDASDAARSALSIPTRNLTSCDTDEVDAVYSSDGDIWAVRACGTLRVFPSLASGWLDAALTLPLECNGEVEDLALAADRLFFRCANSSAGTVVQWQLSGTVQSTVVDARLTEPGLCLSCLSTHDGKLAVPITDDCASSRGAVALYTYTAGLPPVRQSFVTDSVAAAWLPHGCWFGRVTLLLSNVLLVGVPDAESGVGAVSVWDVSDVTTPSLLCHWRPPPGVQHFGKALAARPKEVGQPQLIAVGSEGALIVSVEQIVYTGTTPACAASGAVTTISAHVLKTVSEPTLSPPIPPPAAPPIAPPIPPPSAPPPATPPLMPPPGAPPPPSPPPRGPTARTPTTVSTTAITPAALPPAAVSTATDRSTPKPTTSPTATYSSGWVSTAAACPTARATFAATLAASFAPTLAATQAATAIAATPPTTFALPALITAHDPTLIAAYAATSATTLSFALATAA